MIEQICKELRTQDNCATAHPYFVVQQQVKDWHIVETEADGCRWFDDDGNECGDDNILNQLEDGLNSGDWSKCCFRRRWEFVTACLTRKGCEQYIKANGHNLTANVRIYAECAHRNTEIQGLREFLLSYNDKVHSPADTSEATG